MPIANLAGIEDAASLESVELVLASQLSSVAQLARLPRLREVRLVSCRRITDVATLGRAAGLERLVIEKVPVDDVRFVGALRQLRALVIWDVGRLDTLSFLGGLPKLHTLRFGGNRVVVEGDIQPLTRLPKRREVVYPERRHHRPKREVIDAALRLHRLQENAEAP